MKTIQEVCKYIGRVIGPNPICIETGCTYVMDPGNEVHTTTNNLYEYVVCKNEGRLFSLDIDPEHIKFASSILPQDYSDRCEFLEGDSVVSMALLEKRLVADSLKVGVLCLDSKEFDENHMVNEFNAIKSVLAEKHFVLADDIHNPNSVKYKKMVPVLKDLGYTYVEVPTPTGLFFSYKNHSLLD